MIKVTADSSADKSLLKRLVRDGYIKVTYVTFENGREYKSSNKILPTGVWGKTKWGESIWAAEDNSFEAIKGLVGKNNSGDAIMLEAHLRSENEYFVTEDKDDILSKMKQLEENFGIKVISPIDLEVTVMSLKINS